MAESAVPTKEQQEVSTQLTDTGQERAVDIGFLEEVDSAGKKSKGAKSAMETKIIQDGELMLSAEAVL